MLDPNEPETWNADTWRLDCPLNGIYNDKECVNDSECAINAQISGIETHIHCAHVETDGGFVLPNKCVPYENCFGAMELDYNGDIRYTDCVEVQCDDRDTCVENPDCDYENPENCICCQQCISDDECRLKAGLFGDAEAVEGQLAYCA